MMGSESAGLVCIHIGNIAHRSDFSCTMIVTQFFVFQIIGLPQCTKACSFDGEKFILYLVLTETFWCYS